MKLTTVKAGLINILKVSQSVCVCLFRSRLAEAVLLREQEGTLQLPKHLGPCPGVRTAFFSTREAFPFPTSIYSTVQLYLQDLCRPHSAFRGIALPYPRAPQNLAITCMCV